MPSSRRIWIDCWQRFRKLKAAIPASPRRYAIWPKAINTRNCSIYLGWRRPLHFNKPQCGTGQPANILVVDDTPANLQVLTGMLKERGFRVRPVPSGRLALLAAQRDPPDLILLDINMPDMNGYQVCEQLKADAKLQGIPVIFISALTEQLDKVKAFTV